MQIDGNLSFLLIFFTLAIKVVSDIFFKAREIKNGNNNKCNGCGGCHNSQSDIILEQIKFLQEQIIDLKKEVQEIKWRMDNKLKSS
jgi:formate-dependent nitrite reductase cytochrome c552 subunit